MTRERSPSGNITSIASGLEIFNFKWNLNDVHHGNFSSTVFIRVCLLEEAALESSF